MYVCVYVFMYVASVRSDGVCGKCIWRDGDTSRCKRPRTLKEVMSSSALVSLFVCRFTEKLLNRFSQNSVERWHMCQGRNREILAVIRITLR